jgi:uncharacterized protein (DUF2252 family)
MNVVKATRQFEAWLGKRTLLVKKDLRTKHEAMKSSAFRFLRATYYRWAQIGPKVCPDSAKSPLVLAVGDLHVENFGTWRDIEGRLIWGVNDFDEAYPLPYANDLLRLAVSAHLASDEGQLALKGKNICAAILDGYTEGMRAEGQPYVLSETHTWLRQIAESELRDPVRFWAKMSALPTVKGDIPVRAVDALEHLMPAPGIQYRLARRVAGLGSLGHARFVALGEWCGGKIAREAKALAPSAVTWALEKTEPAEIFYQTIINRAVRCPDPFVQLRAPWVVRRLSPHCSRIELATLQAPGKELRLLHAMGWETANIHLGTRTKHKQVLSHLSKQRPKWLHEAAADMVTAVISDWKTWKKDGYI